METSDTQIRANRINYEVLFDSEDVLNLRIKTESITKDPVGYINEHFDLIKRHMNWRREDLLADINKYTDVLIEENESNRSSCLSYLTETEQLREGIDETTREIDLLRKQLRDTFDTDVNQSRFELIQNTTTCLLDRLSQMLGEYTDALLLHKDLLFIFFDRPIEVVVGKVVDKKQVTTNWLACCFFWQVIMFHLILINF